MRTIIMAMWVALAILVVALLIYAAIDGAMVGNAGFGFSDFILIFTE